MKQRLKDSIMLQIISIIIAIALWLIITYTENPSIDITLKNIPVKYTNADVLMEKDLIALYNEKVPTVSAVVRGKRTELFNVSKNITATIDLSTINTEGIYDMPITINIPVESVELVRKKTASIQIDVEPIISKNIPVLINQVGINRQYLVQSIADTDMITVYGASSAVSQVEYAKVIVDISNVEQEEKSNYSYTFVDKENNDADVHDIIAEDLGIVISNKVYLPKTIPIEIEYPSNIKEDYIINIKNNILTVEAGVTEAFYDTVTSLKAEFPDNVSGMTNAVLQLPINTPNTVYIPNGNYFEVKADIEQKYVKEISVPVTLQNIPNDLRVVACDDTINISVKGPIDKINTSLITASVDLLNQTAGTHYVKVKINTPDEVSVKQEYKISITLE